MSGPRDAAEPTPREARWTTLVADGATAAVLAAGFGSEILVARGQDARPVGTLLLAALLCAALLGLTRRRWLLPAALATAAVLVAAAATAFSAWGAVLDFLGGAFGGLAVLVFQGRADPARLPAVTVLLLLPIAAVLTAYLRRRGGLWLPLAATLAASVPYLLWYPFRPEPVLLLVAGCAALLPRTLVAGIRRERPDEPPLDRAPLQLLAVPVALLCVALALALVPADTSGWRSALLLNQITDWQLEGMGRLGLVRSWEAFGLDAFGFQPQGERLGGPVSLSPLQVLEVRTDDPGLLRGTTRLVYTGSAWESGPLRQYRYGALRWTDAQAAAFQTDVLASAAGRRFAARYGRTAEARVTFLRTASSTIFTLGSLRALRGMDPFDPAYFTPEGDVFVFTPTGWYASYRLESLVFDVGEDGFADAVAQRARESGAREEVRWEEAAATGLQLPAGLPPEVAEAARAAVGTETEPYRRALALQRFFADGFEYTLAPDVPPAGEDFVLHFLETRRGYCTYYATAMAVMARTLGIPARFVEGFALASTGTEGSWLATGHTAHAWVELYFKGVGWLPFDPTPVVGDGEPLPSATPTPAAPPTGPVPSSAASPSAPTPTPASGEPAASSGAIAVLLGLLAAVGAAFLGNAALRARARRILDPARVARRLPDPSERLEYLYADLRAQLACLDLRPESGETLRAFAQRADRHLRPSGAPLPDVLACVGALRYGGVVPTPGDLARFETCRAEVELHLRSVLSGPAYLLRLLRLRAPGRRKRRAGPPEDRGTAPPQGV